MDKEKVHEVVRLCDELKKRAKVWEDTAFTAWDGRPSEFGFYAPKNSAALRRISMELTRALADMRRPEK